MTSETDTTAAAGVIRVVVADDHPIWRSGIRADLGDRFVVVGEGFDAASTVRAVHETSPDLVLCDLHMPGGGGQTVVEQVAGDVPVVILTVSEAESDLLDAVAAGAVGYLLKSTPPEQLRDALVCAAGGEPVFTPQLAALLIGEFRRLAVDNPVGPKANPLSPREREVLAQVARGSSYRAVGENLHISAKTVENHVRNIMAKLHLHRRHELVRWAVDHGIS
jgi:DNA-binding NarL/FixJ family response regulator